MAQNVIQYNDNPNTLNIQMDFDILSQPAQQLHEFTFEDGQVALSISAEIYLEEYAQTLRKNAQTKNNVPKHLNSFSLAHLYTFDVQRITVQERLNQALAIHDSSYSGQNIIFESLNPIKNAELINNPLYGIPRGFGPRIRF